MLQFLKINNFLLFKSQEVNFKENFTVITGETGSGKSMLIKALRFVLGEKIDNLEHEENETTITAEFILNKEILSTILEITKENDIELEDNSLIIRRSLNNTGKNKLFVNDVQVTLGYLKRISNELVEFHSQHKQLEAFNQNNSLKIIDQFANNSELQNKVADIFQKISQLNAQIEKEYDEKKELERDKEYIEHSFKEIKSLNLQEGEELDLIEKKKLFSDRIKIINSVENIISAIAKGDSILPKLVRLQREISKLEFDKELEDYLENSINSLSELENIAQKKLIEFDTEDSIEYIEERLSKIKELSRKYRCTSDQLLNIESDYEVKLEKLAKIDEELKNKNILKESLLKEYHEEALKLSATRKNAAKELELKIIAELKELKLEHVDFKIEVTSDSLRPISAKGIDHARFLIRTNKGFSFAQVDEIASGGELSRIMLAFKVALAQSNQKTTIIFDEIDAGTGGAVAETIGNRMKKLSENNQIIAISHQPQVASKASQHLLVNKKISTVRSETIIADLAEQERIQEIARMLAGINITQSAVNAAISLIKN